jgi:hypothetical protein
MNVNQSKIVDLLGSLPEQLEVTFIPATTEELSNFIDNARSREVPENVITQLADFYSVTNGYEYDVIMNFFECTELAIYEWWENGELWLGQRDFNTLRWSNGKFALGDAGSASFDPTCEADTLIGLIEICKREILEVLKN